MKMPKEEAVSTLMTNIEFKRWMKKPQSFEYHHRPHWSLILESRVRMEVEEDNLPKQILKTNATVKRPSSESIASSSSEDMGNEGIGLDFEECF
jgi:hypothetical protein